MQDLGEGTIRRIDWQELLPVTLLLRIFNVAVSLRILFLALIGVLITLGAGTFIAERSVIQNPAQPILRHVQWSPTNHLCFGQDARYVSIFHDKQTCFQRLERSVLLPWLFFGQTGMQFLSVEPMSWSERGIKISWFVLVLLIWTYIGGVICRSAAVRLTIDELESVQNLRRFMRQRGTGFLTSITLIVLGILCCLIPIKIAGWLFAVPGLNYLVAALFPIPLFFGFLAVILAVGLWFGWSLLFAAVATDGSDGFDAISRLFSYIYQRPLHYLVYWIYCGILGFLGYLLVSLFANTTVYLTIRTSGFSAPDSVIIEGMITIWCGLVTWLPLAYLFAWFWTSSVAIYLLLRRSVDATPFNEVYRLEPVKVRTLPEIKLDEKGAPEIS
ncbi:hypothetical protein FACS1894189_6260 [Planctomycetales bacterium]|nr:hypothetical protein FACS1894189_6260 [Planctomycetales bacterium]